MLINTNPDVGKIFTVKLMSGEEVIGRVAEGTDEKVVWLHSPMSLMFGNEISMMPYMFTAEGDKRPIKQSAIASIAPTASEAITQYIRNTTRLELP